MSSYSRTQRWAAEFLGTAFLVAIGVGSIPATEIDFNGTGVDAPTIAELGFIALAFALVVAASVYAFGFVSGNHTNPAVTLALAVTGKFSWKDVPGYLFAQICGATVGAVAIIGVLGTRAIDVGLGVNSYVDDIPIWQAFTAEFIGTFVLVATIFGVIHRKAANGFAGVAIGGVLFAIVITVAPITGSSLNPVRQTGPMIIQSLFGDGVLWEQWPVYVIAELLGGIVAAVVMVNVTGGGHGLHHWWEASDDDADDAVPESATA